MPVAGESLHDRFGLRRLDPSDKASPRKARRRGLRRSTSALTTTILGAVLTASTVSAQQFLPSASPGGAVRLRRRRRPSPRLRLTPPRPRSAAGGSKADPIVGMAATRGARYLLRNGLDYINYQEYERALKYFREAEARQKELNEAERLALKQAIERAQRGLREAVGSEAPYALSRRSHRAGGFAAAKPETAVAAASSSSAQPRPAAATPRITDREGDDQGEPVRLARAEIASTTTAAPAAVASPEPIPGEMPKPLPLASDQPAQLPEIPKLPQVSETAGLPGDRANQPWCNRRGGPPGAARWQRRPAESGRDPGPDWLGVRRASQAA